MGAVFRELFGYESPRSGQKRKAWGVSPRNEVRRLNGPRSGRYKGIRTAARIAGLDQFCICYLGLTPQALRFCPLRGLS